MELDIDLGVVIDNMDTNNVAGTGNNKGMDTAGDTDMVVVADNPAVEVDMTAVVVVEIVEVLVKVLLVLALFLLVLYLDKFYNKNFQLLKLYTHHKVISHINCIYL